MIAVFPPISSIKDRRKRLGLSQIDLAIAANVSQSTIAKIEGNRMIPSYDIAIKIFTALEKIEKDRGKIRYAKDLMSSPVVYVTPDDSFLKAKARMVKYAFSQLPVINNSGKVVGSISERILWNDQLRKEIERNPNVKVKKIMQAPFPQVPEETSEKIIKDLLMNFEAVLVIGKDGDIRGIITKADILKTFL